MVSQTERGSKRWSEGGRDWMVSDEERLAQNASKANHACHSVIQKSTGQGRNMREQVKPYVIPLGLCYVKIAREV